MMKRKKTYAKLEKRPRINMQIRVPQVQLIDESGKQLGVTDISKAIRLAYEKELDLVEVSPRSPDGGPPIAKIMDFGKFMYQKEKREKERKKPAAQEVKTVKIGLYTSEHDLMFKAKQVDKFIKKGYTVRVEIFLRGREKALKNEAIEKLKQFPNYISEPHNVEGGIKPSMSGFLVILRPSK